MAGTPLELGPTQLAGAPSTGASADAATEAHDRLAVGARAGEYVIERFIGAGAMGEVYAGDHPVIGKRVAVKVLRRALAASPEAAERFIREARAVNQVDHANVVDVFAFGRLDDGRLYLVMDLIAGRSLRAVLADGPLPTERALEVLTAIAGALDAAHARGVVHRDLKPDNIVIADDTGAVFVLDFGIAKLVSATGAGASAVGTLTGAGTWLGTPGYMAPEQWSADGAGPASDRYALGMIAFELLTGKLPFEAASVPAMMEAHFRSEVPTLSARGAHVPAGYDAILARALAKDPDARFATALAMVDAMRSTTVTGQGAKGADVAVEAAATARGAASARRSWVPAAAGIGVLGAMVAGWVVLHGDGDGDGRAARANASAPNADETGVRVDVMSDPPQAQVSRDGKLVGTTPTMISIAPDAHAALELTKPGYLPARQTVTATAGEVVRIALPIVNGFDGVWQLPSGELRAFERRQDAVVVYKLDSVEGERHYYRRFEFEPVAGSIVRFGADEDVIDTRAPDDPTCRIAAHVQYDYDPSADALELRQEHLEIGFENGHCLLRSRALRDPVSPTRVDHAHGETVSIDAPAGLPPEPPMLLAKSALPSDGSKSDVSPKPAPAPAPKQRTIKAPPRKIAPNPIAGDLTNANDADQQPPPQAQQSLPNSAPTYAPENNAATAQIRSSPKAPTTIPEIEPPQPQAAPPPSQSVRK